jgi:hypothetical protein
MNTVGSLLLSVFLPNAASLPVCHPHLASATLAVHTLPK